MANRLRELISELNKNEPPDESAYSLFVESLDFVIDKDYASFLEDCNGAEGILGKSNYIVFWCIEDLVSLNPYYEDIKECEELFFFGSDGSNLGYAFKKSNGGIVSIDFLDISQVEAEYLSDNFFSFICLLSECGG